MSFENRHTEFFYRWLRSGAGSEMLDDELLLELTDAELEDLWWEKDARDGRERERAREYAAQREFHRLQHALFRAQLELDSAIKAAANNMCISSRNRIKQELRRHAHARSKAQHRSVFRFATQKARRRCRRAKRSVQRWRSRPLRY